MNAPLHIRAKKSSAWFSSASLGWAAAIEDNNPASASHDMAIARNNPKAMDGRGMTPTRLNNPEGSSHLIARAINNPQS